jgi:hypothetical protein
LIPEQYNLNYRPTSYWGADDTRSRIHRIKGQDRKETAWSALSSGDPDRLADPEFDQNLPDDIREFRGSIHPQLMGGEYLPDFIGNEVEIARVSLASVTGDVISIRARIEAGRVHYSIMDEYEGETVFHYAPTDSAGPLTLGELVGLIDGVTAEGMYPDGGSGLTSVWRDANNENGEPRKLVDFVTVSSEFYPELEQYYASEAEAWLESCLAEEED